ncbi:MAG TPA: hypothetical protein VGJ54_05870, partial [Streptosporangiaceae bacterium]
GENVGDDLCQRGENGHDHGNRKNPPPASPARTRRPSDDRTNTQSGRRTSGASLAPFPRLGLVGLWVRPSGLTP